MMNRLLAAIVLFVSVAVIDVGAATAQNEADAIRRMLQERDRQIKNIVGDRTTFTADQRERLKDLVNDVIDFREMGRLALGNHWNDLSEAQRSNFVDVFSQIVRNQSLSDLEIYRARVQYGDITVSGNTSRAVTTTQHRNVTTTVEYDLIRRNNTWMIRDISLDGVSTAEGYARSFQNVIRRRGFDALMDSLNRRLERGS